MKQNSFPLILEPGAARKLNDDAIRRLGAPIFFFIPQNSWPNTGDPFGKLYAVVIGLHQIYHEAGTHILSRFLNYCWSMEPFAHGYNAKKYNSIDAKRHIETILILRNGLCHGSPPEGQLSYAFQETLASYRITSWPPSSRGEWQSLSDRLIPQLVAESNEFVDYLKDCINLDEQLRFSTQSQRKWPRFLVNYTLNPEHLLYGETQGERRFFGINLIWDLANHYPGEKDKSQLSRTVQQWLTDTKALVLNGGIENSDTLSETLTSAIRALYEPSPNANTRHGW